MKIKLFIFGILLLCALALGALLLSESGTDNYGFGSSSSSSSSSNGSDTKLDSVKQYTEARENILENNSVNTSTANQTVNTFDNRLTSSSSKDNYKNNAKDKGINNLSAGISSRPNLRTSGNASQNTRSQEQENNNSLPSSSTNQSQNTSSVREISNETLNLPPSSNSAKNNNNQLPEPRIGGLFPEDSDIDSEEEYTGEGVTISGNISGKILDNEGLAVTNGTVTASPFDIAAGQSSEAKRVLSTTTDDQGNYLFTNVATASFKVCSKLSSSHTKNCINLIPPQKSANIKVQSLSKKITVSGRISDETGNPAENIQVRLSARRSVSARSDNNGEYTISLTVSKDDKPTIFFKHNDYSSFNTRVFTKEPTSPDQYEINPQLTKKTGFTVTATVYDQEGNPVSGQRIGIRGSAGRSERYLSSNSNGTVKLKNIPAGDDYVPVVLASPQYTYTNPEPQPIIVFDNSASFEVRVQKKQNSYGELRLYINNQAQQPVSSVVFELYASGRRLGKSTSDENGELVFNNIPEGNLVLQSRALPLRVSGLKRKEHNGTTIMADEGQNEIIINIIGANGNSVLCKHANINWTLRQAGMNIRSDRTLVVDQNGVIEASGLGAGDHNVTLSRCEGYKKKKQTINIGSQVQFDIELSAIN